jgi:hypothetical protein
MGSAIACAAPAGFEPNRSGITVPFLASLAAKEILPD